MSASDNCSEDASRLLQASGWQIRLAEDDSCAAEFNAWLAEPANAEAWAQLARSLDALGQQANDPRMIALRRAAMSYAHESHVRLNRSGGRSPMRALAIAAALVATAGATVLWTQRAEHFETRFGERRVITLEDGSRISLDSDSEVAVRYSKQARTLSLLKGQARFDVAHDIARPFSVMARSEKVVATGTAFNIDIIRPETVVTLIEGRVTVVEATPTAARINRTDTKPQAASIHLIAGQQLAVRPEGVSVVTTTNVGPATSWTSGQLVFDDAPLSEVVARVNHYSSTPIFLTDERIRSTRISGSFTTGDTSAFLDIVSHYLPVRQAVDSEGRLTLRAK